MRTITGPNNTRGRPTIGYCNQSVGDTSLYIPLVSYLLAMVHSDGTVPIRTFVTTATTTTATTKRTHSSTTTFYMGDGYHLVAIVSSRSGMVSRESDPRRVRGHVVFSMSRGTILYHSSQLVDALTISMATNLGTNTIPSHHIVYTVATRIWYCNTLLPSSQNVWVVLSPM